jgi:hypothetical protein
MRKLVAVLVAALVLAPVAAARPYLDEENWSPPARGSEPPPLVTSDRCVFYPDGTAECSGEVPPPIHH